MPQLRSAKRRHIALKEREFSLIIAALGEKASREANRVSSLKKRNIAGRLDYDILLAQSQYEDANTLTSKLMQQEDSR